MSARSARLNVRLPEEDARELEAIRERTGQGSISDVVRGAIACYLHEESATWNSEKISAIVPASLAEDIEMLIASGDATDLSQAVTLALTAWVEERKQYHLEGREKLRNKIAEAAMERDTRKGMSRIASRMNIQ